MGAGRGRSVGLLGCLAAVALLSACGGSSSQAVAPSAFDVRASVAAAAANPVTVSPLPGTPDASPATQVSFLGETGLRVLSVSARGSRSGAHTGRIEAYSTGTGASFLPSHPFVQGERVTVSAQVQSASGPAQSATTTFTVAHQASVSRSEFPNVPGSSREVEHFLSAPSLAPSTLRVTVPPQPGAASGDLFLAPYQGTGAPGPAIYDQLGNLVWFHPLPAHEVATNFQVESYQGHPALVWWQGRVLQVGFGQGEDVIYSTSYQPLASIRAGNGYHADLHEIRLTPQGTAWVDAFDPIHMNLASSHGSASGILLDSIVQQVDIKTGLVMWEWHALGHIPLGDSFNPPQRSSYPWDYIHINSIDPGSSGDVLLSARNSWTLYDVDMHSGGFRWRLGGPHSSFHAGSGTNFYWQHDAEFQPGGLVSVFDNAADPQKEKQTRGLLLDPNTVHPHGHAGEGVHQPRAHAPRRKPGQPVQPPRRELADGLRAAAQPHRVLLLRAGPAGRHARAQRAGFPLLPFSLDGSADQRSLGRRAALRRRARRGGELERRHRGRLLAGARGLLAHHPHPGGQRHEGGLRDDHPSRHCGPLRGGAGARRLGRGARHLARDQGLEEGGAPKGHRQAGGRPSGRLAGPPLCLISPQAAPRATP